MKKLKILPLLTMLFVSFFTCTHNVHAAEITDSKYENGKIYLTGTGDTQVQIVLFGLGNSPMYMTTANIENEKFSITLPQISDLKQGDYTIKVADYNGKNVSSKVITVSDETTSNKNNKEDSSSTSDADIIKTGDEKTMYIYSVCSILIIISSTALLLNFQKNRKKFQDTMIIS